jgi:V/A-type H+-transporting ATPase subunit C
MAGDLRRYAAANARVRTLLSTLVGRSGLEALCGYPSVDTVLDALQRTPYGRATATVSSSDHGLLARLGDVGRVVLNVLDDPPGTFLRQYLLHHEVATLKVVIRAVARHLSVQALTPYLIAWPGISTVAAEQLVTAADLRELVERVGDTPYGTAMQGALHRVDRVGPFALEVALDLDYYDRLWASSTTLRSADCRRAQHLLGILFDILNLGWISRYHTVALSPEEILNYTLRQGRWITPDIRRVLAEDHGASWAAALERTPYAALLGDSSSRDFDAASVGLWRLLANEIQRALTGYPFHIGVPFGFLLAQDIEIRDLRVLLAAKGMGVPSADIIERLATVRH